jgi:hypothetical protein
MPIKKAIVKADGDPWKNLVTVAAVIFAARNRAHELHLRTESLAQHLALNELYDALLTHADKFVETAQGKYGIMRVPTDAPVFNEQDDPIAFIGSLATWFEDEGRACINPADTYLLNQLDEVLATVYSAKYKLENLS